MSISVFPAPSTAAGPDAKTFTVTAAYATYEINDTFTAGGYTITTSPSTSQVEITFVNASGVLGIFTTVSGTVSGSIASDATQMYIKETSGSSNTVVTIDNTASNASGATLSGTLDTITNTSTYNETGLLYVMAVGGGGGGHGGFQSNGYHSAGGASGGIDAKFVFTNTSTSITIGTGGNGGGTATPGNTGGATSFGNLLSVNGGGTGNAAGTPGGARGGAAEYNSGSPKDALATSLRVNSIKSGTTGGGGSGAPVNQTGGSGAGSGIGTGGNGGASYGAGNNANGYGAGGGGGGSINAQGASGGNGTSGVVYVLRGF